MVSIDRKKLLTVWLLLGLLIFMPARLVFGQSTDSAKIGIFKKITARPDTRIEVPIEIRDVEDLYALDITVNFDPAVLAAEDADSASQGVQMALGSFLDPGLVLYNTVDNTQGTAHFVMTQYAPSESKSGSGVLLVIYFKGLKPGESKLGLTDVQLSTRDGMPITASVVGSSIAIDTNAPTVDSTPIPVQESTQLIQIPTLMPATPDVSFAATATAQAAGADEKGASVAETQQAVKNQSAIERVMSNLARSNWRIVLLMAPLVLLLLVIAAATYLVVSRKKRP